ncbi:MAG: CDP-archaeol synthase [Cyclobacteriaceae bacterium]|nr:CDP-archaeol synthase [Cyclobacteriaceae bacterium]
MVNSYITHILIVIVPLVLSNTLHMFIVKKNLINILNYPIWPYGFGKNKTWRGILVVVLLNALFLAIINLLLSPGLDQPFILGLYLGLAYTLAELPNSFFKRRWGIAPGGSAGTNNILFHIMDKTDSAFGVLLTYYLLGYTGIRQAAILFFISSLVHTFISIVLVRLKLKSSF